MSLQNMTKLQAVNRILRAAREHPVSSLGSGGESDTLIAEQILDEVTLREQMIGLHINQTHTKFTPDSNDEVILPINTVEVRGSRWHQHRNYFFREVGGQLKLFDGDKDPATTVFADDDEVYVRLSQCLDFESLPPVYQYSIVDQAAAEYAAAVLPSNTALQLLEARAARSRAMARAADIRHRPSNMFEDSRSIGLRLGRDGVARSWPYNDQIGSD